MRHVLATFILLSCFACKEKSDPNYKNPFVRQERLREVVKCLKADKANQECRKDYDQLKRIFAQKQCSGDKSNVGFFTVHQRHIKGHRQLKDRSGRLVSISTQPLLTPEGFEQLFFNACHSNPKSFAIFISLKPEASKVLADATAQSKLPISIALVVDDVAKVVAPVSAPIAAGQIELCLPDIPLESFKDEIMPWFCEKYESEELPPEFVI